MSRQTPIEVYYDGELVGDYFADIVVDGSVILELKAAVTLCEDHRLQLVNYLRATDKQLGLLLNFGRQPEFKRALFSNDRKIGLKWQDYSSANHRIPQIRENSPDPCDPCTDSEVFLHG